MHFKNKRLKFILLIIILIIPFSSCASSMQVEGNENGSVPISDTEIISYNAAVARCYKTGGSRVIKIDGKLRCF